MSNQKQTNDRSDDYLEIIKKIVSEIRYGSINLIIQDGKVIQIDRVEKIRI